jgi:hypothetical protein
MSALSNYLENKLVDHIFRAQAYTAPATVYVALFTAAPSDSGGGTEITIGSNGYQRKSVSCSLAAWAGTQGAGSQAVSSGTGGVTSNNAAITFDTPTGSWGTVTHFGIFDAASAGNLMLWGALTVQQTINTGNTVSFAAGQLQITFA